MMKLAIAGVLVLAAACGGKSKGPTGNTGGGQAVPGDVDGDGKADEVTFADGVVTVAGVSFTVPADFNPVGAEAVDLGTETVVAVQAEIVEDDLTWRILQFRGGALHDLGDVFLGSDPRPDGIPGDGTIHATTGNCGQSTALVYKIVEGKIEKDEKTTGTYDETQCAACPYVLVDTGAGLAFVGESLRNLVGPAAATEDTLALPALDGQRELVVVLSEVKPETTYLDAIAVDFAGTRVAPRACAGAACAADDTHEVFTLGERRRFVFDVPAGFTGVPVLHATGYYQPFAPTIDRDRDIVRAMKRTVVILAALLAVAGGCKKRKVRRDREVDVARRGEEAIFVIGRPRVEAADIPGRFAAPLPSAVDEIDQAPPSPFVWNALAADKFGIRQKLLAAVAMAAHGGAIDEDLRSYFVNNLQAAGPRLCDWIAAQTAAAPEATRTIFWEALSRCTGPATIAALARDDVPSATLIDYYFESSGVRVPFQPRVAKAAAELAGTREEYELRKIGFAYAAMDGPEVVPSMLALQRTIPDRKRRALVALGLLHHPDPAAKALGAASCRDPDVAGDSMCGGDDGDEEPEDAPADLASAVTDWDFDPKLVLSQFRRDDVIAALQACATSTEDDESLPALCLTRLAGLDRAKAVTAARARPRDPDQPALDAVIAALLAFPDQGALERELAGLGFTPRPGTPPPASPPISVEEVLEAGGYVHRFDTETGTWPNQHDDLLAQLAALAAPALDDVLFEEVPQGDSDGEDPYTLGAYADGNRYRLEAKNLGDWYDVEAVLGLLNAVLVARKSDVRFTILPTGDQTASVLAGKRAAILTLVQRKLIAIAAPGEAEATGKDFEDRVMQQLQREGKLP